MNREKKEKERKINKLYASRRFSFFSFFLIANVKRSRRFFFLNLKLTFVVSSCLRKLKQKKKIERLKLILKVIRNDTNKRCKILLEGWDEKMKRFFQYIGAQFIRKGRGAKSIWNCFIPLPKLTATLTSSCKSFQVILEKWPSQRRDPPPPRTKDF